jgi:hypothetical protein
MNLHFVLRKITVPAEVKFVTTGLQWHLRSSTDDLNEAIFESLPLGTVDAQLGLVEPVTLDAWELRAEFLACSDLQKLQTFLNKSGEFSTVGNVFSGLCQWQDLLRSLLEANPDKWPKLKGSFTKSQLERALLDRFPRVDVRWEQELPTLSFHARNTLHAMVMATQVDYLQGKRFRFCLKPECRRAFEITTRHKRWYCGSECAKHVSVRRHRERLKAKAARRLRRLP